MERKDETYCPCCASDYTEFQQTDHSNGTLTETFNCNYCDSTFQNVYIMHKTNVVTDNSHIMHMDKAKEVLETELQALGDNITNSRGFADGRVYMLLDCLKKHLNELDSIDLSETYKVSSFHREYED
jgi:hypothetical protein